MEYVIRSTKKKMNIPQVIDWYEHDFTLIHAIRSSERGAVEEIYIAGAGHGYSVLPGEKSKYISDTGFGHGGKGTIQIINLAEFTKGKQLKRVLSFETLNNKKKLPLWIMV